MNYKIGIDIDDCVTQTVQQLTRIHREKFGSAIYTEDLTDINAKFENQGLISIKDIMNIKEEYKKRKVFRSIKPYPHAVEVLKELQWKAELFFITSRDDYESKALEEDTNFWLNSRGIKKYTLTFSTNKGLVAKNNKLDLFLEDSLIYASQVANEGIEVALLKRPWNKKETSINGINYFNSWKVFHSYVRNKINSRRDDNDAY